MPTTLKKFFNALTEEEGQFIPRLAADNLGIVLRCAINELDWYYYNLANTDVATVEQREQFYIMQLGVTRLIQLSLDARDSFDVPVVLFTRRPEITLPVLQIVSALGIVEHGRRVAQTVVLGKGRIEQVGEKEFSIVLPERLIDDEYFERAVFQHYQSESSKEFTAIMQSEAWKERQEEVASMLNKLVYPFMKYFIGYDADPLLDDYFFGRAYQHVQSQQGFDSFNYAIRFGGIRFQNYILALIYLISNYIRHEQFCEALVKKDDGIRLENILTITSDTDGFVESIRDAVNYFGSVVEDHEEIDITDAHKIFMVLSCSRKNTSLISAPGSPLPLIVQNSEQGFIRCLTGAYSEPVRFLLESLRHHYPKDYDKNQQTREVSMQRAVQGVLNDTFDGLDYRHNIKVKIDGKISTDIDLAILEKRTGIVVLCQLKHQEMYGSNLHAKRVRADRLNSQIIDWLAAIEGWIEIGGNRRIRDSLCISKDFPKLMVYRLIITMHYSHPLKEVIFGTDISYANWLQFVNANLLVKRIDHDRNLADLMRILREHQTHSEESLHLPEPKTKWKLNELKFTTRQESPSSSS